MPLPSILRRLRWPDLLILAVIAAGIGYVVLTMESALSYEWRWGLIPDYILRWSEERGEWVTNLLLQGLITTLRISIYAGVLALILGVVLGIARCARNLTVSLLARTYMELLRNIPPVVIIFIFFFFLSQQLIDALSLNAWSRGIARGDHAAVWEFFFGDMRRFPSLISGVIVLALFESAFVGEIVRAGIQSTPTGQREAAKAIGMGQVQEMRYVVLPQALRKVTPPMANQFISLIKDSSIISLISVQDLTYKTVELVSSTRLIFEAWITTAALYFLLCFGLSLVFRRLERRR
ncbi:MAG: amino acid ABC transporter permease [Rhodobacterales bacterium]|nr:amino acid ABC transporter permease [Rhodobacterales bacterium]